MTLGHIILYPDKLCDEISVPVIISPHSISRSIFKHFTAVSCMTKCRGTKCHMYSSLAWENAVKH